MQETGRAGRDGGLATCILYYSYSDAVRTRHMLKQSAEENHTSPEQLRCNMDSLNAMVRLLEHGEPVWVCMPKLAARTIVLPVPEWQQCQGHGLHGLCVYGWSTLSIRRH